MSLERLVIPQDYKTKLSVFDTQVAIKLIKDAFQTELAEQLNLRRVSAPLFLSRESGLNDNLNGTERPVSFEIKGLDGEYEVVHSLAKWKRMALRNYDFYVGNGLYTDMNAIRRDEDLDNIHSVYVDQWDWEKIITKEDRNDAFLEDIVRKIIKSLKETERRLHQRFDFLEEVVNEEVFFITAQELLDKYPDLTPKEREYAIVREYPTVFIKQIGSLLSDGSIHDGRAPDYDDWALNGDILVYNKVLDSAFELSSMGIRVDETSLKAQLKERNCEERLHLEFHQDLANGKLPLTIGGGIGQSRLCMYLLQSAHIGEVQVSSWSKEMIDECKKNGIFLL
jgi:aspartate--ammonia ligase, AsnA-type